VVIITSIFMLFLSVLEMKALEKWQHYTNAFQML